MRSPVKPGMTAMSVGNDGYVWSGTMVMSVGNDGYVWSGTTITDDVPVELGMTVSGC